MAGETSAQPATWRGEVTDCPPSANVFMREHWSGRARLKKRWSLELFAAFHHDPPTKAIGKRRVRVAITSKRARDHSNLWLAADKLIFDNLTALGWIVDDSTKWIEPEVSGAVGEPRTVIEIWGEQNGTGS